MVSPFPPGDHKADLNRQDSSTDTILNNKNDPRKKHRFGMVSKNPIRWYPFIGRFAGVFLQLRSRNTDLCTFLIFS